MRSLLSGAALCLLLAGQAAAQASASVATTGSTEIMDPAQFGEKSGFAIGKIALPKTGVNTAVTSSATYTLVGKAGENFAVSLPKTLKLVRAGGSEEITVTLTPSQTSGAFTGVVGEPSATTIGVAASAPVASSTAVGTYSGQISVTRDYN